MAGDAASGTQIMHQLHDASFRGQPPCEEMEELHLDVVGFTAETSSSAQEQDQQSSSVAAAAAAAYHHPSTSLPHAKTPASSSSPPCLWARRIPEWGFQFYIRLDRRAGSFHTYPDDFGGPFKSLKEAEDAIDRNLHSRRIPKMCLEKPGIPRVEKTIRDYLYWPDGTRRRRSRSEARERTDEAMRRLVQAVVDNYNEDHHNLFLGGAAAYELKDVVHYTVVLENRSMYYHFNFTLNTKGAADDDSGGIDNLFFAEVENTRQGEKNYELVVTSFCMLKPTDNGHCYGCTNNRVVDMKHPDKARAYIGGHLDLPFSSNWIEMNDTEDEEAAEKRIRRGYKGYRARKMREYLRCKMKDFQVKPSQV